MGGGVASQGSPVIYIYLLYIYIYISIGISAPGGYGSTQRGDAAPCFGALPAAV